MNDAMIIGGGPAGISAALTLRAQGRSVLVISGNKEDSGLYKAKQIDNYPGMPGVSGAEMLEVMEGQLQESGAEHIRGIALSVMKTKNGFMASVANDVYEGKKLILALGAAKASAYDGEERLLGNGVSYCAVCDGVFYKKKKVVVFALRSDAEEEAEQLRRIGCEVTVIDPRGKKIKLLGETKLETISVNDEEIPAACVFILRPAIAPSSLIAGLETTDGAITADRHCRTSIDGVFAAGDCSGKPYQIAKAVGDGQIAAFSVNSEL